MCKVFIIRHAKVDFRWRNWCDSKGFDRDCLEYDRSPLTKDGYDKPELADGKIYISSLPRSRDTANMLFGEKEFIVSGLIDEVPLKSCIITRCCLN